MASSNELLLNAAKGGNSAALSQAIRADADVEAKSLNGLTAMMWAASRGHLDCLSLLIKAGADIHAKNPGGSTASMWAAYNGHFDCVELIEAEIERRALAASISTPSTPTQRSSLRA